MRRREQRSHARVLASEGASIEYLRHRSFPIDRKVDAHRWAICGTSRDPGSASSVRRIKIGWELGSRCRVGDLIWTFCRHEVSQPPTTGTD